MNCTSCTTDGLCPQCGLPAGDHQEARQPEDEETFATTKAKDDQLKRLRLYGGMLLQWSTSDQTGYTGDVFPQGASDKAKQKMQHIKEEFYSMTGHTVVTPDNTRSFIQAHQRWKRLHGATLHWDFWELWSGSGRTSWEALQQGVLTGPPIDYRYGWDINDAKHRALIEDMEKEFQPKVVFAAPDCRCWSAFSNCSPQLQPQFHQERHRQRTMLQWLVSFTRAISIAGRAFIIENPMTSQIWRQSPLHALEQIGHRRRCSQCMYGLTHPTTKRPMRKDTGFLSNLTLRRSTIPCNGRHDHTTMEGTDPKTGLPVTATAATYPRPLARALANDIRQFIESTATDAVRAKLATLSNLVTVHWSCERCRLGKATDQEHTRIPGECRNAEWNESTRAPPKENHQGSHP